MSEETPSQETPSPTASPTEEASLASPPNPTSDSPTTAGADIGDLTAGGELNLEAIDELLKAASAEDPPAGAAATTTSNDSASTPDLGDFKLPDLQQVMQDAQVSSIDLLRDVDLDVKIELGRSRMLVEDVLKLAEGSVVELDKLAGDPVDVFV